MKTTRITKTVIYRMISIPIPTGNPGPRPNLYYEYKGYWPHANGYKWTREKMEEFDKQGRLIFPDSPNGRIQYKQYLDEMKGTKLQDIWLDVYPVNPVAKERNGYPTQKSEALLERIIKMCAPKNGLVFDCFMGSGTTQAAAMKLGRRFIGADINLGAIQTTTKRLLSVAKELEDGQTCMETSVYKGYKRDKIEMRGDRVKISDFPLYLNTVAGGLDCRDQTIGGFSFVVKIYAVPVVEIIGQLLYLLGRYGFNAQFSDCL